MTQPFPKWMSTFGMPVPRLSAFKEAAYANVARAALALADGKPKESERLGRAKRSMPA